MGSVFLKIHHLKERTFFSLAEFTTKLSLESKWKPETVHKIVSCNTDSFFSPLLKTGKETKQFSALRENQHIWSALIACQGKAVIMKQSLIWSHSSFFLRQKHFLSHSSSIALFQRIPKCAFHNEISIDTGWTESRFVSWNHRKKTGKAFNWIADVMSRRAQNYSEGNWEGCHLH